jgi:diguanylate cyclase (GGDEF)-like protein
LLVEGNSTQTDMTRRRTALALLPFLAFAGIYALVCSLLPVESIARLAIADLGLVILECALLVFCWVAYRRAKGGHDLWIWLLIGGWALGNLLGDAVWTYYEVVRQVEVPTPGLVDIGYLAAHLLPVGVVLVANKGTLGRLKTFENTLDAAIFTLGAAGLAWPLILEPMFNNYQPSLGFWMDFSYPALDLLVIFGFVSLLFGYYESTNRRLPAYFTPICAAFLFQVVADSSYFLIVQAGGEYVAGGWVDTLWMLSYACGGIAAVLALRTVGEASAATDGLTSTQRAPGRQALPAWRTAAPYVTLPILAAMISIEASSDNWHWDLGTSVLMYMGIAMLILLVGRQYVASLRNRGLYGDLAEMSRQLENRVADLANVNQRLENLNDSSHRLTSLRQPHAVARAGLEMACTFTGSRGGWINIDDDAGSSAVTYGIVDHYPQADPETIAATIEQGILRAVTLPFRDGQPATMWLLDPVVDSPGTDLLPLVVAQMASAFDNATRYEEVLRLAERDPLTGLYNHRGIHRRLAGEILRAQQSESELSLIMIDLDDFKVLNDTYGHVAGDSVLRQVSDAIRAVLRHADLAGRVGGDELLLVLPNTGGEGAMQLSERLRVALAARPYLNPGGQSIPVYLSLGVATMPADAMSVGGLIEVADSNLYASKQCGGNTTTGRGSKNGETVEDHGVLGIAGRLLDAVGARDHYTRRHSEHVVRNALGLGEALGLPAESLRTLQMAAMLHDVGKIGVSSELLRRPGSLTPAEEEQVRKHVLLGSHLIMDIPRLAEVAATVSAHHERYDGTGYPEQTTGEDTPLLGRILAVADAYSAMTLDRPYRKSMTRMQAREELLKAAGTQLDPELVREFIRVLDARVGDPTGEHATAG